MKATVVFCSYLSRNTSSIETKAQTSYVLLPTIHEMGVKQIDHAFKTRLFSEDVY